MQHAIPRQWQRILTITSAFHMERSQAAMEWVFGLENVHNLCGGPVELGFLATANDGLSMDVVQARLERETQSTKDLRVIVRLLVPWYL